MPEIVDTYKNVFEQEDSLTLPNIEKHIKEEIIEEFQDVGTPFFKVPEPFEPIKIPKFLKEVRVSLSRMSESEILKYTQRILQENTNNDINTKFLKEVRVSLQKLSESEILKYTQRVIKENTNADNSVSKSNQNNDSKCEMCGLFLASEKLLQMHKVIVHPKLNDSEISKQKTGSKSEDTIVKKYTKIFEKVDNQPNDGTISLQALLIESARKKFENGPYTCNMCDKSFPKKSHLKAHVKTNSEKCDKNFPRKDTLNFVHENIWHKCDKCDKRFVWKKNLDQHMKSRHIKSVHKKAKFNCDKCYKSFPKKDLLYRHIHIVHGNVPHKCDHCDKSFSWKSQLSSHIQIEHQRILVRNENEPIRYNCDKCDKSFLWKTLLNTHIKCVHT